MNNLRNKLILATVTSIAIIFTFGNGCRDRSNSVSQDTDKIDKSNASKSGTIKTQEYKIFIQNKLKGIKDTQGNVVIPAKYEEIDVLNMQPNYALVTRNDLQGLIDLEDSNILLPFEYDEIDPIEPDLDGLYVGGRFNRKLGLFDSSKRTYAIPPEFDRISYVNPKQGYSIVTKDGQTGVYDFKTDIPQVG